MAALLKKRALAELLKSEDDCSQNKKLKPCSKVWNSSSSASAYIGMLSMCKTSNEALQLLLRVSETTSLQCGDLPDAIRKLTEHLKSEKESAVRVKIISLFADFSQVEGADISLMMDEIIEHMKNEESHKVLVQSIRTLLILGGNNPVHTQRLIQIGIQYLKDSSELVKCACLDLLGSVLTSQNKDNTLKLIVNYSHSQDPRVRSTVFKTLVTLHRRGHELDVLFYDEACNALNDVYEIVRLSALNLIAVYTRIYSEHIVKLNDEDIRLVDDAFGKVCLKVCDLSMRVRTRAITMLGNMKNVSQRFLHQTLDKKLMSNMRLKKSAHERSRENVTSGEWASGAKWADDAPREVLSSESVSLIATGSCGVLVHALEDEYQEVRIAGVDTLCNLALDNPQFAMVSLDFLVDMFNDEIEEVRLRAIESLTKISSHIILREDQLETMLGALKDFSLDVREGLYRMLSSCRLSTKECIQMIVDSMMENLRKYPQDKKSIFRCFQKVGGLHPELTLPLVPELLAIHPFFDTPEADVEDAAYIGVLILILNAAENCPMMFALFEGHTNKHYIYLRDTMTTFVPQLKLSQENRSEMATVETGTSQFLIDMIEKIKMSPTNRVKKELMTCARRDLIRLSESDSHISGAALFISLFISCELNVQKIIEEKFLVRTTSQSAIVLQLLQNCLKLEYSFTNLTTSQICSLKHLKLKCLSLLLIRVSRSNQSALTFCHYFLQVLHDTQRYLLMSGVTPEHWVSKLFNQFQHVEDAKPGHVARTLYSSLKSMTLSTPPSCTQFNIGMCKAEISEPTGDGETAIKFTAGLIAGIPFDSEITCLTNVSRLRIKIKYPDQNTILVLPRRSDLRPLGDNNYRLLTTALLTHQVWTEACYVDISLVLDVSADEGLEAITGRVSLPSEINPYVIDICKPVKVYVSPKPIKRGI